MQKLSVLKQQAISAAKNLDWQLAVELNNIILEQNKKDLDASNRLGLAHLQLKQVAKAKKAFLAALKIDKSNKIAKKNITKLKNNQNFAVSSFKNNDFIEEPGKAKTIQLHRLANKKILNKLSMGQACLLAPKNRYISLETKSKTYIGALPEDISFRLSKLIKDGNTYICTIHSCTDKYCCVHIREDRKSKKNAHINSFPLGKNYNSKNPNDDVVMEKSIKIKIIKTDEEQQIVESVKSMAS